MYLLYLIDSQKSDNSRTTYIHDTKNKDGVRTSVHYYHYVKNSVRQFPQSSVQNFMRDFALQHVVPCTRRIT